MNLFVLNGCQSIDEARESNDLIDRIFKEVDKFLFGSGEQPQPDDGKPPKITGPDGTTNYNQTDTDSQTNANTPNMYRIHEFKSDKPNVTWSIEAGPDNVYESGKKHFFINDKGELKWNVMPSCRGKEPNRDCFGSLSYCRDIAICTTLIPGDCEKKAKYKNDGGCSIFNKAGKYKVLIRATLPDGRYSEQLLTVTVDEN